MAREGIQKVAVLVESGVGAAAQQFVPLRALLNGNVGTTTVISGTFNNLSVNESATINNPNNSGIHIFVNYISFTGSAPDIQIELLESAVGLPEKTLRAFRIMPGAVNSFILDYHPSLTDNTIEVENQRLTGLLPSRFKVRLFILPTPAGTATVDVHAGLMV